MAASAAALILLALIVSGLWSLLSGRPGHSPATTRYPRHYFLVLTQQNFGRIATAAPRFAAKLLSDSTIYLLSPAAGPASRQTPAAAVRTALFSSDQEFTTDLSRHLIPSGVRAVAYDPEDWSATPASEQEDPHFYMARFTQVAHRSGYQTILMPGSDLLLSPGGQCRKQLGEKLAAAVTRCGLAGEAASLSRIYEVQTAPDELSAAGLRGFASASERQASQADPSGVMIGTLSTTSGDRLIPARQLIRDAEVIRPFVRGFQLNLTWRSTAAAIALLRAISPA